MGEKPRGMYRVAGLLLSASGVRYAGQLVLLVLIARFGGAGDVGVFTVALAVCAPVYIIAGFGIRTVFLTLHRPVAPGAYERFLLVSLACAGAVVCIVAALLPGEIAVVLLVVAVIRTGETYLELYSGMLQRAGRPRAIVLVVSAGTGLQIAAACAVFLLGGALPQALLASAAMYSLNLLLFARPAALRPAVPRDHSFGTEAALGAVPAPDASSAAEAGAAPAPWRALFAAGLPTGVAIGMITLLSTVPQYLLGLTGDVAAAGRFAVLLYVVVAVEMVLHALAQSWIPHARTLLRSGALGPAAVARTAARWTALVTGPGLAGLVLAALLLPVVLGPEFAVTLSLAVPLLCCVLLVPTVFAADTAVVVRNRYSLSLLVSVSALTVGTALGLALTLLGVFGLRTALWTFAATMAARAAGGLLAAAWAARATSGGRVRSAGRVRGARHAGRAVRPADAHAGAAGALLRRYWLLLPIAAAATAAVAGGPLWSLGAAGAVVLLCLLCLLRVGAVELLVITVPLAFYITAGGMLVNLAVSDVLLLLLLVRILADPACAEAFAQVTGTVKAALCVVALLLTVTSATVMARGALGARVDWTAFAADAFKLLVVIAYFIVCVVVFRDLCARGDFRFLRLWALTAAVVGALGTAGAVLFAAGAETGLTMDFRATGTFEDPNAFATYLIMSVPLALLARHLSGRSLLSWHLVPILAGVIASFSRGALVGIAAVLLMLCAAAFRDPALRSLRFLALLATGAAVALVMGGAAGSLLETNRGVGFGEDVRFRLWEAATDVWLHSPVFGVGLGQFITSSKDLLGSAGGVLAHNTFLSVLAEGGVLGAALYFALPGAAAVRLLRRADTAGRLLLISGAGAAVMGVSLNLQNFRPLWMLLALAFACTASTAPAAAAAPLPHGPPGLVASRALPPRSRVSPLRDQRDPRTDMSWN